MLFFAKSGGRRPGSTGAGSGSDAWKWEAARFKRFEFGLGRVEVRGHGLKSP